MTKIRNGLSEISPDLRDEVVREIESLLSDRLIWSRIAAVSADDGSDVGGAIFIANNDLYLIAVSFLTNLLAAGQNWMEQTPGESDTVH